MTTTDEILALLTLQHIPFLGDGSIKKLIQVFGTASNVLQQKEKELLRVDGIGTHKLQSFWEASHREFAEKELEYITANNIRYRCYMDDDYPQRLKHCIDGPVLLFEKGNIDLSNQRLISIVGTRKISSYGERMVERIIEDLAPLNPVIISGFAYGVDILAHKMAVKHNIQTIAVLAHGLNQVYPKTHQKYCSQLEDHGGFMTDFWSSDSFVHTNFLQRNRIIAGLSEATLVIESAEKGGSLVTADFANGYSRDVFAVPGRVGDTQSVGCNNLIKQQKAHLLTSAADLVYILNWDIKKEQTPVVQKKLFVTLDEEEKKVFHFLKDHNKELLDTIALNCEIPIHKMAGILLNMELKGVIRPLPGKLFELL